MKSPWRAIAATGLTLTLALSACAPDEPDDAPDAVEDDTAAVEDDTAAVEDDTADVDSDAEPEGDPIVIGGAFSVTDWMSAYDGPPREGATAAVAYLNEQGGVLGRPLELIESDSQSDPAVASQAALELIDQGAHVLVTPCDFDIGAPVGIEAQREGLPVISTCATSPGFPDAIGDMMFMTAYGNNRQAAAMAEWSLQEQGWENVYLIIDQSIDYTRTLGEYFGTAFEAAGGQIVGEDSYTFGDEDYSSQISNFQSDGQDADMIYIASLVPDIGTILRQFRAAGIDLPVASGDGIEADLLVEVAGADAANNTFFTTHGFVGEGAEGEAELFVERYEAMFDDRPETSFHAIGWDTIMVIARAIEDAGSVEPTEVRDAMEQITDMPSATGRTISYSPDSHVPEKDVAIVQVVDGTFELMEWWQPASIPAS
jgi:branched-chain amino acid transport system substrate-binding protein